MLLSAYCALLLEVITTLNCAVLCAPNPKNDTRFCEDIIFEGFGDEQKKSACPYSMQLSWRKAYRLRVNFASPSAVKLIGVVCQVRYEKYAVGRFKQLKSEYVKLADCYPGYHNTPYYYNETQPLTNWTTEWHFKHNPFLPLLDTQIMCSVIQKPGVYWKVKELIPPIPDTFQTSTTPHVYKVLQEYIRPASISNYYIEEEDNVVGRGQFNFTSQKSSKKQQRKRGDKRDFW